MLNIRLSRVGKTDQPSFRILVQEHTASPKGKFIEVLGNYNPVGKQFKVDVSRVNHWLSVGAKPSDTLAVLLKKNGVEGMDKFIRPRNRKTKKKGEEAEKPATPVAKEAAPAPAAAPVAPAEAPAPAPTPAPEAPAAPAEAPQA